MSDEVAPPQPGEFKTKANGQGGLVRATLVGAPHDGRALYMDELELPTELWTTGTPGAFEWWRPELREVMAALPIGNDPAAPPVRYVLRIPDDTREPIYVAEPEAG